MGGCVRRECNVFSRLCRPCRALGGVVVGSWGRVGSFFSLQRSRRGEEGRGWRVCWPCHLLPPLLQGLPRPPSCAHLSQRPLVSSHFLNPSPHHIHVLPPGPASSPRRIPLLFPVPLPTEGSDVGSLSILRAWRSQGCLQHETQSSHPLLCPSQPICFNLTPGWCYEESEKVLAPQSCLTLCKPMDYNPPGSSVMRFPRQNYKSGLPCPPPGHLPNPWMNPGLLPWGQILYQLSHSGSLGDLMKWGLWEVIRSWGWGPPEGISALVKVALPSLSCEDTGIRWLSGNHEAGSHQTWSHLALWASSLQNRENNLLFRDRWLCAVLFQQLQGLKHPPSPNESVALELQTWIPGVAGEAQRCGPWALPKASGLSFSLLSVPQPLLHSCWLPGNQL